MLQDSKSKLHKMTYVGASRLNRDAPTCNQLNLPTFIKTSPLF